MATEDRTTRLKNIRDHLEKELEDETVERREAQARGEGVKTNYTFNGRTVDWNGYVRLMLEAIDDLDQKLQRQDPWEFAVRCY